MDPAVLVADRALLGRSSTAERVADILRTRISEGHLAPGGKLSEDTIGKALGVSRNTLREAFRLLTHEKLLVHELNRGVFVRMLTVQDVIDIYRVRRLVECSVVRHLGNPPYDLAAAEAAVAEGEQAAAAGDWLQVGTANTHFHDAVVALGESVRLNELMRGVLAELRLGFHVMGARLRGFHESYLARNRDILAALRSGAIVKAELLLADYLDDAEEELVRTYAATITAEAGRSQGEQERQGP
ncbi:GntR-family transcriptional regulator [Streptomyces viridochromogenes DSM 40736]|uniref:GntR-family transcriptional regulator n=1 Tax=Streptomyces viridochromogenes (strain DSM 40736 / JCM 4977 / BCRC 1201 / Tue 494) TaxID=591159 RepID=D9X440_STRVT|nr:GntR-family transcriptional regulator [Streptomyces viridochromogenes DSM 40736]